MTVWLLDITGVIRVAEAANAATRTLGVAFDGCTLPGADSPLFTVPDKQMGVGLGIHGEPGVRDEPMPSAADLAVTLVDGVLDDQPKTDSRRIAVILNGLGRTKYEELFVVWGTASRLLRERGYEVVEPEVGELVTSLDMAGCSLTVMWLDDELEKYWTAPADSPAYRKGVAAQSSSGERRTEASEATGNGNAAAADAPTPHAPDSDAGPHSPTGTRTAADRPGIVPARPLARASPPPSGAVTAPPPAATAPPAPASTPDASGPPTAPVRPPPEATPRSPAAPTVPRRYRTGDR
jgi:hypothetical protein